MNTIKENEFDYQTYMQENAPDPSKIRRGAHARKQRFEKKMKRMMIRIDEDILEQFQEITSERQEYEKVINQALQEWLSAKTLKELVREELQEMVQQAFSSKQLV